MSLHRYFVVLSYNGGHFHGWQIQPNAVTVQEWVNKALSTLLREEINVVGCGRTDTGVHARNFVAHFDSQNENLHKNENLVYKLNRFLPRHIAIHRVIAVHPDAHARFDATLRTYKYYISTVKDPFNQELSFEYNYNFNIKAMNQAASVLTRYSDFTSFSKVDTDAKTNICDISEAVWELNNNQLIFTIKADRFLRNMVRAIVGTILDVGFNKISVDEFCEIIEVRNRSKAGTSAPAQGLFLEAIEYPYSF